jgi:hypothetical protein
MTQSDDKEEWLVQGVDVASGRMLQSIDGDPEVKQVAAIASDVAVLQMSSTRAEKLKAEFGNRLIVEKNRQIPTPMRN